MNALKLIGQSFGNIWHNKVRSTLTILGIVIGIAAVISLVGLGKGLQARVTDNLTNLDAKQITITSQDPDREIAERAPGGSSGSNKIRFAFGPQETATLTTDDYAMIRSTDGVEQTSPEVQELVDVTLTENASTATQFALFGVDTSYFDIKDVTIVEGSNFSSDQIKDKASVALIGKQAAEDLFPNTTTYVGKTIYIKDKPFVIIGVTDQEDSKGMMPGGGASGSIFTGYSRWMELNEKDKLSSVIATAKSEDQVESIVASLKRKLLANHNIIDESKADFGITTNKELLATISNVSSSFGTTLGGIAAISLLVGGIGIMNIMLVTVTERTREIGLRRAVGAKTRHILAQFLIESLILTVLGGIIGLLAGFALSGASADLLAGLPGAGRDGSVSVIIDTSSVLLALGVSSLIGIVFGLFPAIKAARLDPVEALRYE